MDSKLSMQDECRVLSLFYNQLSQLYFDKARELVEKQKDVVRPGPCRQLLALLPNLVVVEKSYVELAFVSMKNKIFLRKDNSLRSLYESFRSDLNKLEDGDEFVTKMAQHLNEHAAARILLIDLYERMYAVGSSNKSVKATELLVMINAIQPFTCHLEVMAPFISSFSLEVEILKNLLQALSELLKDEQLPCLTHLHVSNTYLATWEKNLQNRESWKLGFGASFLKGNQMPALYQWLVKLKYAIVAKFSLYFHTVLVQQTSGPDMRAICSKHNIDHMHKIHSLQRKHDAICVVLLFDALGGDPELLSSGPGYQHPERAVEPLDEFTVMLSYPIKPLDQLPTITKALSERRAELSTMEVICIYCVKEKYTYYMSLIDPRVTLVVVFDSKKDDRETSIKNNINELCAQLRWNRVFALLKLNNK
ncbi:hypothetical protein LSTR_LSTR001519 [Laodelphax striatellus]|uniref:Uncharacterized protein n=1 Tax=Laodelphax striatellus TaxID=195883 RepID=A0A482XCP2_LAOST|nr:hypothetical protein LSTR_LSTR001519 [Laodelphax striatellus]